MIKSNLKPVITVLSDLKNQGYNTDFHFKNDRLIPFQHPGRSYGAREITLKETYRFEGDTDPGDASIMYVIETDDGLRGTITNGYNAEADTALDEFMARIKGA